jgi:hypothetical protein
MTSPENNSGPRVPEEWYAEPNLDAIETIGGENGRDHQKMSARLEELNTNPQIRAEMRILKFGSKNYEFILKFSRKETRVVKTSNFLRYIVFPAAVLAAGVKLGIKYAEEHYVSKDRKFIEGEISPQKEDNK